MGRPEDEMGRPEDEMGRPIDDGVLPLIMLDLGESIGFFRERCEIIAGRHEGYTHIMKGVYRLFRQIQTDRWDASSRAMCRAHALMVAAGAVCFIHDVLADARPAGASTGELDIATICCDVRDEMLQAAKKFPKWGSPEEGYGVMLEETDELWELAKQPDWAHEWTRTAAYREAVQVASTALTFVHDLVPDKLTFVEDETG